MFTQIVKLSQDGKQVGGLFDCEVDVKLEGIEKKDGTDYKPHKRIAASSYWLLVTPQNNEFDAEFYSTQDNHLVLVDAGRVKVRFPDTNTLDKKLHAPISVGWISDYEH